MKKNLKDEQINAFKAYWLLFVIAFCYTFTLQNTSLSSR